MTPKGDSELVNMSSKKEYLAEMRWRYDREPGEGVGVPISSNCPMRSRVRDVRRAGAEKF